MKTNRRPNDRQTEWLRGALLATTVAAAATLTSGLSGCGDADQVSTFQSVLPLSGELELSVPEMDSPATSSASDDVGTRQQALVGQVAPLAVLSAAIAIDINVRLAIGLRLLHDVTHFPPSSVTDEMAVWGPWAAKHGVVTYQLEVSQTAAFRYEYRLLARPRDADGAEFAEVVSGSAQLVSGGRSGELTVDATALHELNPVVYRDTGKIVAAYDTSAEPRTVDVQLIDFSNDGRAVQNSSYSFKKRRDRSGEFSFVAEQDLPSTGPAVESYSIVTRWQSDRAGRSDANATGGDLATDVTVSLTECWNKHVRRTYYQGLLITEGDGDSCVF